MRKTNIPPPLEGKSPKRRFEKFVSALIRVPKKEIDEKQKEIDRSRKPNDILLGDP
jgi:hypothetical protein